VKARWLILAVLFALVPAFAFGDTYPAIPWPGNEAADALDGTTHAGTQVPFIAKGADETSSPTLNVQMNRNEQRLLNLVARVAQGSVWAETALDVGAFPMAYQIAGVQKTFGGATGQAVTDDDTNYVYLDADQTLKIVTDGTGWPADESTYIKLASVVAAGGAVTSVTDLRFCNLNLVVDLGELGTTTSATFQLDSGSSGPLIKAESTTKFGLRNAADAAYVDLQILDLTADDATVAATLDVTGVATFGSTMAADGATLQLLAASSGPLLKAASASKWDLRNAADSAYVDLQAKDLTAEDANLAGDLLLASGKGVQIDTSELIVPYSPSWYFSGAQSVKVLEIEWVAPVDFTIIAATGRVNTAPTGAALICDVRVDGNSIFTNQAEMINIAAAAYQDTSATKNHAVTAGEVVTIEIEQIGSAVAGSDLTVVLNGRAKLQE